MTMPNNNSRILLQRLKKTLSELGEAQARLNKIVKIIAEMPTLIRVLILTS